MKKIIPKEYEGKSLEELKSLLKETKSNHKAAQEEATRLERIWKSYLERSHSLEDEVYELEKFVKHFDSPVCNLTINELHTLDEMFEFKSNCDYSRCSSVKGEWINVCKNPNCELYSKHIIQ